ncbi:MAG: hypothetical protein K8R36_13865 [Planctomycetales bacterium]|nr:hypothetical protein [Planctomycetales bacterium]
MHNRGKLVVLSIFGVALAMASFALWWNWGLGKRSLEFWGTEGGLAIRDAKKVEIVKLKSPSNLKLNDKGASKKDAFYLNVQETKDVTGEHGLVHARHSLLEDASFQWDQKALTMAGCNWKYAVRFQEESKVATVLLDLDSGVAGSWEEARAIPLSPKTAAGWKLFINRYYPDEVPNSSKEPAKSK